MSNEDFIAFSDEVAQELLSNPNVDLEVKTNGQVKQEHISHRRKLLSGNGVVDHVTL